METACEQCPTTITITGDGSTVYLSHPVRGGIYFCSHRCRQEWEQANPKEFVAGVVTGRSSDPIPFRNYVEYQQIMMRDLR
jgi:hypothetical protein